MTRTAIIFVSNDGWCRVISDYNKKFVEALKSTFRTRRWSKEERAWYVLAAGSGIEYLKSFCLDYYENVDVRIQPDEVSTEVAYDTLCRLAGLDALKNLYKSACRRQHPDRGGSHEDQVALNLAWERIQKVRIDG